MKTLVERGSFPLLSLLQRRPLEMQFSHLSIQEYLATRELCDGRPNDNKGVELPWQWGPWWKNVLRMGCELGLSFSQY